jgi:NAD(P)H-nitrite reductase large subunit
MSIPADSVDPLSICCMAVLTSAGVRVEGHCVVSATGVAPSTGFLYDFAKASDGSLVVDDFMMTAVKDVYAAGDCCSYQPQHPDEETSLWFQMKLWTQVVAVHGLSLIGFSIFCN